MSSTPSAQQVQVGTSALIFNATNPDEFLIGWRISKSHGTNSWQLPGGHLDLEEEVGDCAVREANEETGLNVKALGEIEWTNDIFKNEDPVKHYITHHIACEMLGADAVPRVTEPDKCAEWRWETREGLEKRQKKGEKLFLPLENLLKKTAGTDKLRNPKVSSEEARGREQ
uniref:Nudix hydrolase domain-containing protein n=1 Tax=Bionectria ochroleuca TaxID=29856 RepID=A0A8H7NMH6_BIOOC